MKRPGWSRIFARAYHNLGYAYQHLGRLEDALEAYDMALERVIDPNERAARDPPFPQHLPDRGRQSWKKVSASMKSATTSAFAPISITSSKRRSGRTRS